MGRDRERRARQSGGVYIPPRGAGIRTVPLREDLLASDAYHSLKPTARLVLVCMLQAHFHATAWEKTACSFAFPWSACEFVSEGTFTAARRAIVQAGFFEVRPEDQSAEPGAPVRYRASNRWQTLKAPEESRSRWQRQAGARRSRVYRDQIRRSEFRAAIQKNRPPKIGVNKADHPHKNCGGVKGIYPKNCGDGRPKTGGTPPQKIGCLNIPCDPACDNTAETEKRGGPVAVGALVVDAVAKARAGNGRSGLVERIRSLTGDGAAAMAWWEQVLNSLTPNGRCDLVAGLDYIAMCGDPVQRQAKDLGELHSPGKFLVKRVFEWGRRAGVRLPDFPKEETDIEDPDCG